MCKRNYTPIYYAHAGLDFVVDQQGTAWLLEVNPEPSLEMFESDEAFLRAVLPLELPAAVVAAEEVATPEDTDPGNTSTTTPETGEDGGNKGDSGGKGADRPIPTELPLGDRWKLVYSAAALRQLRAAMRALNAR